MALQGQFGIICANNLWLGRVDRAWRQGGLDAAQGGKAGLIL
jgi:hypothetical protein